jgi:hypothetical protein
MHFKAHIVVFIIQVETFWVEVVLRSIIYPNQISQTLCQSYFCSYTPVLQKVVSHLKIFQVVIVYLPSL